MSMYICLYTHTYACNNKMNEFEKKEWYIEEFGGKKAKGGMM